MHKYHVYKHGLATSNLFRNAKVISKPTFESYRLYPRLAFNNQLLRTAVTFFQRASTKMDPPQRTCSGLVHSTARTSLCIDGQCGVARSLTALLWLPSHYVISFQEHSSVSQFSQNYFNRKCINILKYIRRNTILK